MSSLVSIRDNGKDITVEELQGFFVGWLNHPTEAVLLEILQNSRHCVVAYDEHEKKVVGFVNCISDGIFSAYIPLLEVLPSYQK